MQIAVDLNASFAVHAGSCVWRLLSSSVAMMRREGVCTPSLLSCGCFPPRVTALSWSPCPIDGGMAENFGAASWMDEGPLSRVAGVVGARSVCVVWWPRVFCHFPLAVGMSWEEMVVDVFSSCMVGGCWRCVPFLRGCRLVVCELCGWSCCPLRMLSALSLCIRCAPSLSLLLRSFSSVPPISSLTPATPLRVTMAAMMTVRRRVGPCALVLLLLVRVRDGDRRR
ncbi:surface protease GP63 [Trypanosoma cruzi]|nr:surface protease GP63 [Trypanosoma cruzi]